MRCGILIAPVLGVAVLLTAGAAPADACFFFHKRPAYRPVAPAYYAPPPAYYAPPVYAPPRVIYPAPAPSHLVPGPAVQPTPARPATAANVSAKDNSFDPPTLNVAPGTTVRWTNTGAHPHTVTDRGGKFDSGDIAPGASYTMTFQTPGTYRYYCKHHKGMEGTIVVGEPGKAPAGGGAGSKVPGY